MMAAEQIKAQLSMLEMAVRYGFMPDRSGRILCPFHDDNNPSLYIYDEPGRGFYCFSCGTGGSVIDFVMLLFKLEFKQAVLRITMDFGFSGIPIDKEVQARIYKARQERAEQRRAIVQQENLTCTYLDQMRAIYDDVVPFTDL